MGNLLRRRSPRISDQRFDRPRLNIAAVREETSTVEKLQLAGRELFEKVHAVAI